MASFSALMFPYRKYVEGQPRLKEAGQGVLKNLIGFRTYLRDDEAGTSAQSWARDPTCFSAATTSYLRTTEQLEAAVDDITFFAASNGESCVIMDGPHELAAFIVAHSTYMFVCHDAAVDFHLVKRYLERNGEEVALQWWWEIANRTRLRDTGFLDTLIRLGLDDIWPSPRDFNVLLQDYLPQDLVDEEILRPSRPRGLRYYPPVNSGAQDIDVEEQIDLMYIDAVRDVKLLALAYPEMYSLATRIMTPHRAEILSNTMKDYGPLSEGIQVKASIVLADVTRNGMAVDIDQARRIQRYYEKKLYDATAQLVENPDFEGMFHEDKKKAKFLEGQGEPGAPSGGELQTENGGEGDDNGDEPPDAKLLENSEKPSIVQEKLKEILAQARQDIKSMYDVSVKVPKTAIRNTFSTATKTWLQYAEYHPFIRSWVEMDRASRHLAFLDHLREPVAHPEYTVMVRNGRSSCGGPAIQQTPRKGGFREMFRASEGRLILSVDYDFIELCTLASVCEARYGYSNLAEVIRKGVDPHSFTASMFEGVELAQFMSWKDSSDGELRTKFTTLRQRAKPLTQHRYQAINFGIPGGLSAGGLQEYAKTAYNVELSYPEAVFFKKRLTKEVYPELHKYLREREFAVVAHNLQCTWEECIPALALKAPRTMSNAVKNLIRGRTLKLTERHKSDVEWQNKVWEGIKAVCHNPEISKMIEASNNVGSDKLFSRIFGSSVTTLTGRVRGFVTFTQACNTPFSGLAADGAKLAMWNLYMVGYRIIGFIHDEILVEIDEDSDWTAEAQMVERIVCEAMQELNGTIPISCSFALSRFWSKSAAAVYDDKGRLTVWKA